MKIQVGIADDDVAAGDGLSSFVPLIFRTTELETHSVPVHRCATNCPLANFRRILRIGCLCGLNSYSQPCSELSTNLKAPVCLPSAPMMKTFPFELTWSVLLNPSSYVIIQEPMMESMLALFTTKVTLDVVVVVVSVALLPRSPAFSISK